MYNIKRKCESACKFKCENEKKKKISFARMEFA